jgi:hypothetical protein
MATSTSDYANLSGNFTGEKASGYLYPAILAANTIGSGIVTTHENVKYKLNIRNMATTGYLANGTCDFTPSGNLSLSDVVLEVKELQVNTELCKKTFRTQWEALEMRGAITGQELPASFQEFFIQKNLELIAKDFEVAIWQGTTGAGSFEGLQAKLAANGDVVDVTGTTLSASNIIAELGKVYAAIPDEVFVAEDVKIIIPISAAKFYQQALAAIGAGYSGGTGAGYKSESYVGAKPLNYQGIDLVVANGLGANKMVAARSSDLHFGTNVLTDLAEVRVIDMAETDGSDNVRFVARMTGGTQVTNGSNVVYYS